MGLFKNWRWCHNIRQFWKFARFCSPFWGHTSQLFLFLHDFLSQSLGGFPEVKHLHLEVSGYVCTTVLTPLCLYSFFDCIRGSTVGAWIIRLREGERETLGGELLSKVFIEDLLARRKKGGEINSACPPPRVLTFSQLKKLTQSPLDSLGFFTWGNHSTFV